MAFSRWKNLEQPSYIYIYIYVNIFVHFFVIELLSSLSPLCKRVEILMSILVLNKCFSSQGGTGCWRENRANCLFRNLLFWHLWWNLHLHKSTRGSLYETVVQKIFSYKYTHPETNIAPEYKPSQRNIYLSSIEPSIFWCYVSFREGLFVLLFYTTKTVIAHNFLPHHFGAGIPFCFFGAGFFF